MERFRFFRVLSTDYADVCGFAVLWDLIKGNKKDHCVSALGHVAIRTKALSQASNFVSVGLNPMCTVTALAKFGVLHNTSSLRIDSHSMVSKMVIEGGVCCSSMGGKCIRRYGFIWSWIHRWCRE